MRNFWKRALVVLLTILIVVSNWAESIYASPKEEDKGYAIYLAGRLMEEKSTTVDIERCMLHRLVYNAMKQDGTKFENTKNLSNLMLLVKDSEYLLNATFQESGMVGLYEEVILEIILKSILSDENYVKEMVEISNKFMEIAWPAFSEMLSELEGVVSFNEENVKRALAKTKEFQNNALPYIKSHNDIIENLENLGITVEIMEEIWNLGINVAEFVDKLSLYIKLQDSKESYIQILKSMYRYSEDEALKKAINNVISKLELIQKHDLLEIISQETGFFMMKTGVQIGQVVAKALCRDISAVAMVNAASLVSEILFNTTNLAEYGLLLEAQIGVEDSLKEAITYMWNSYRSDYDDSVVFNQAILMLYDCYEYGNDLVLNYAEAVLEDNLLAIITNEMNGNETLESYQQSAKLHQTIIDNSRALYDSFWKDYEEEYGKMVIDFSDIPIPVEGIFYEKQIQYVTVEGGGRHASATITPAEATNQKIYYTSSDPTIVSITREFAWMTFHREGTVTITATSEDGGFTATQTVVVTSEEVKAAIENGGSENKKDIRDVKGNYLYEENEDGVTFYGYRNNYYMEKDNVIYMNDSSYEECYEIGKNGTITFNGKRPSIMYIPEMIDGKPVTEVDMAYLNDGSKVITFSSTVKRVYNSKDREEIQLGEKRISIILNEGLEIIGEKAFMGYLLDSIRIPSTVQRIEGYAFYYAYEWERLDRYNSQPISCVEFAPQSVCTEIGEYAFYWCDINHIILPEKMLIIGDYAFCNCKDLTTVTFSDSIKKIGDHAFYGCLLKNHLKLPANLQEIDELAFGGNDELISIEWPNTLGTIKRCAFSLCDNLKFVTCYDTNNTIHYDALGVGASVFERCYNLKYIEFPSAIPSLGESAIYYGVGDYGKRLHLQTVILPDTLQFMEKSINRFDRTHSKTTPVLCSIYIKKGIQVDYKEKTYSGQSINVYDLEINDWDDTLQHLELPVAIGKKLDLNQWKNFKALERIIVGGEIEKIIYDGDEEQFLKELPALQLIQYYDEDGNLVTVYERNNEIYVKTSQYVYEDSSKYLTNIGSESNFLAQSELIGTTIRINGNQSAVDSLQGSELQIYGWQEQENENRALALGEFLNFEDLYLQQDKYYYFNVVAKDESVTPTGEFQIIVDIPADWNEHVAMYHIGESGLITRLKGEIKEVSGKKQFWAISSELGNLAIAKFEKLEEVINCAWEDELHLKINGEYIPLEDGESVQTTVDDVIVSVSKVPTEDSSNAGNNTENSSSKENSTSFIEVQPLPQNKDTLTEQKEVEIFHVKTTEDNQTIQISVDKNDKKYKFQLNDSEGKKESNISYSEDTMNYEVNIKDAGEYTVVFKGESTSFIDQVTDFGGGIADTVTNFVGSASEKVGNVWDSASKWVIDLPAWIKIVAIALIVLILTKKPKIAMVSLVIGTLVFGQGYIRNGLDLMKGWITSDVEEETQDEERESEDTNNNEESEKTDDVERVDIYNTDTPGEKIFVSVEQVIGNVLVIKIDNQSDVSYEGMDLEIKVDESNLICYNGDNLRGTEVLVGSIMANAVTYVTTTKPQYELSTILANQYAGTINDELYWLGKGCSNIYVPFNKPSEYSVEITDYMPAGYLVQNATKYLQITKDIDLSTGKIATITNTSPYPISFMLSCMFDGTLIAGVNPEDTNGDGYGDFRINGKSTIAIYVDSYMEHRTITYSVYDIAQYDSIDVIDSFAYEVNLNMIKDYEFIVESAYFDPPLR